ncbi:alkylated DNA repair protein alkB homolog 8 [Lucilia sericata]|uniref:alkylated DNA repair protein alkB homolog 8 n=1 Tax=Lucilia sericata TaxID=13632 RepID=UPI0018A840E5|nr:alkylated DNA repair protein alkB homolog 8 [Lucilia sericata]
MTQNYKIRKLDKKQKRCEAIIQNDCKINASKEEPTKYVGILNAGLSTGLTEELVLETAEKYGQIKRLLMLPSKSYCFLECANVSDAVSIVNNMHGLAQIGQNQSVVYLSYFVELPEEENSSWLKPLPDGLIVVKDFVTEQEEYELLKTLEIENDSSVDSSLKHRRVKHFGYEFLYDINNVNPEQPLERKIPSECDFLWKRLENTSEKDGLSFEWREPDQLTVNSYEAGQGIPPHVDTHSAFLDPILSLSLEGDIVMEFRKGLERSSVLLPRRSLLIMSGESRYDWTHGITPRVMDVVLTSNGNLSTKRRTKRTSLTFRKLRNGPCLCKYPTLCDSKLNQSCLATTDHIGSDKAALLEELNVHTVYDTIAEHFSETRHSQWPQVAEFLKSFNQSSVLLDVGCGNGKYLNSNTHLLNIGCDRSNGLLKLCKSLQYNVFRCDCLHVPVRSNSIDGCISIAVIHHLATAERRLDAIKELVRILRPSGRGLIYVWAKNQIADNKKSSYLRQNKSINKNKTTEDELRQQTQRQLEEKAKEAPVALPVHSNRTTFQQQDVLVPWKVKTSQDKDEQKREKPTFLRYYHVFEENELDVLLQGISEVKILKSYYDQGNHCCIFEKVKITVD